MTAFFFFWLTLFSFFFFNAMLVKVKILAQEWHKQIPYKLVSRFLQTVLQPSLKYPCWSYAKPSSFTQLPAVDVTFQRCQVERNYRIVQYTSNRHWEESTVVCVVQERGKHYYVCALLETSPSFLSNNRVSHSALISARSTHWLV